MKNKFLKIFALIFCVAFLMTGCATVSNVKINGKDANFKELQHNQGQVLVVGDYLYYGNGYTSSSDSDFDYNDAKSTGYLSRINLTKDFTFSDKVTDEEKNNSSPKQIEKVNDKKLIGYQHQDMFALGEYIYFTSANTHKTNEMQNDYTQVSLFRMKFNGDGLKELVKNSAFKQGDGCTITTAKGSDNNYYYIIVEPGDNSTFTIKALKIGNKIGKIKTIAKDVTSYAIADQSSTERNIIYTTNSEQAQSTSAVKSVDFASGKVEDLDSGVTNSTIAFLGRVGDVVFYSYTYRAVQEVYYKNIKNGADYFNPASSNKFYNATTISNIKGAGDGYIFKTSDGALIYKELTSKSQSLMESEEFSDILFVENDYVYTSSSNSIKRISVIDQTIETIISLENENQIISGECGYDGQYIYYYSQLDKTEWEDEDGKNHVDEHYYMYRTDKNGNRQLIGKRV